MMMCDKVLELMGVSSVEEGGRVVISGEVELLGHRYTLATVRHGKWLVRGICAKCSECGQVYNMVTHDFNNENYCPHCGAKMEKEQ